MLSLHFSLKVEDDVLHFQDANFKVSSPFSKSEINEVVTMKLRAMNYRPDLSSISYVVRENQFYAEGVADEDEKPPSFNFFITD